MVTLVLAILRPLRLGLNLLTSKLGLKTYTHSTDKSSQHGQSGVGCEGSLGTDMVLSSEPLLGLSGA